MSSHPTRPRGRPGSSAGDLGPPSSRGPRSSQDLSRLGLAPPSEPRPPSRPSIDLTAHDPGHGGRLPVAAALVLALVLVAVPLYLWRRPRVDSIAAVNAVTAPVPDVARAEDVPAPLAAPAVPPGVGGAAAEGAAELTGVQVGEPRVLSCNDGAKRTAGEACDRLPTIERALARAVEESAACITHDAAPGSIQFSFDVGFRKKTIVVTTPREARSIKSPKTVASCTAQVKSRLSGRLLEGVPHAHERYRIVVTAAYPATPRAKP